MNGKEQCSTSSPSQRPGARPFTEHEEQILDATFSVQRDGVPALRCDGSPCVFQQHSGAASLIIEALVHSLHARGQEWRESAGKPWLFELEVRNLVHDGYLSEIRHDVLLNAYQPLSSLDGLRVIRGDGLIATIRVRESDSGRDVKVQLNTASGECVRGGMTWRQRGTKDIHHLSLTQVGANAVRRIRSAQLETRLDAERDGESRPAASNFRSDPLWKALERTATAFTDDPSVPFDKKAQWWGAEEINRLAAAHALGDGKVFETRRETEKTFGGQRVEMERFLIVHDPAGGDPIELHTWSRTWCRRLPKKVERIVGRLREWQRARERQLAPIPVEPAREPGQQTPVPKRPSDNAFKAWRLRDLTGLKKQGDIATTMSQEIGRKVHQGEVSRWLTEVDAYLKAGCIFPELPSLTAQPQSTDPAVLEMGEREDHRTPRQRRRRKDDSYSG